VKTSFQPLIQPEADASVVKHPLALSACFPRLSARLPVTRKQGLWAAAGATALVVAIWLWPGPTLRALILAATVFYLLSTLYKLLLVRLSVSRGAEIRVAPEELAALDERDLPVYSILVPLYREPESVANIVAAIAAMDYPKDKLDVQLLLEEDDSATRAAADALSLPPGFRVTLVPWSFPRTKPKACNIGLAGARGDRLVIYDAEDRPEPDQLRKAVAAFRALPPEVICLQCKLNFYNPRQNLLTRWFAGEYATWFDLSLPGLSAMGAVVPLGGTSNHFSTAALRGLLGWDAYNVTEDCDLGLRIYRRGGRTRMLDSTTWEEACSSLPYWIRQRTRWLKGYMQTWLVHMRDPVALWRELGPANFFHVQTLIGGMVFSLWINPLFWAMALVWFFFRWTALMALFPGPVFLASAFCLFAGNFMFVYLGAIGCYRRRYFDLVKYALAAPPYWALMSWGAWRAFGQFFSNPFHWEKTRHGLVRAAKRS
jgi:cellulose synthase/poly-beta-1,6-N-acetylglucosamine synthase-like glycosyltransferase